MQTAAMWTVYSEAGPPAATATDHLGQLDATSKPG